MTKDINRESLDKSFEAAKKSLEKSWMSKDAWEHLEDFAETSGYDTKVAQVYADALELELSSDVFEKVAHRAVNFYEEWFGDSPQQLKVLLTRIIELDDSMDWAFNRLTELLSSGGDWEALFEVYDRALESEADVDRKKELLTEAANIARDMADLPDKALFYLLLLQKIDKKNKTRLASIERMLEKRERWEELIELWQGQLEVMSADAVMATKLEIARCYIEKLSAFEKAFEILDSFLKEHPGNKNACVLGEAILVDESASVGIRLQTLEFVLANYQAADQPESVVRVILVALQFAREDQKTSLYRKAGATLSILGKDEQAIGSYAALLALDPTDGDAIKQLRLLSVRSKRFDLRAEALINAAAATTDEALKVAHLSDAAELYVRYLGNTTGAIDIYSGLLKVSTIEATIALQVAHNLNELLFSQHRDSERLAVLEKIAELESTSMVRRTVYQEAAKLAEHLLMPERALVFWKAVLEENQNDLEALGACIKLMHQTEQWADAIVYLEQRACAPVLKEQRRSDLVQVAAVQLNYLEDVTAAISTWKTIFEEFGPRPDSVSQLDTLLSGEKRFDELAEVLNKASSGSFDNMQYLLLRLGDVCRLELGRPLDAVDYYQKVLALNIHNEEALASVKALLKEDVSHYSAVKILEKVFEETQNWPELLALTNHRMRCAKRLLEKIRILEETAAIYEQEVSDSENAFEVLCQLLPLSPMNEATQDKLVRLAEVTEKWDSALVAFKRAVENSPAGSIQQVQLKKIVGKILEEQKDDLAQALLVYLSIEQSCVPDGEIADKILHLAAQTGVWDEGVASVLGMIEQSGQIDLDKIGVLEGAAESVNDYEGLATALEDALKKKALFQPAITRDLWIILANWYQKKCQDSEKAKESVKRAVEVSPESITARKQLADFQRATPNKAFLDNLRAIYKLREDDLDPLMEAATTAVKIIDEYEQKRTYVVTLFEEATRMWRLGSILKGNFSAQECVLHAVTQTGQLDLENGLKERAAQFLLEGAKLPFDEVRSRFLRKKAALIFAEMGLNAVAIDVYNQVLVRNPDDIETLMLQDALLEKEQRILELLSVRQKRLELTVDAETQIALRLDISTLGGLLEGSDSRLVLLKENLEQIPGESGTIAAVEALLEKRAMHRELVDIFWKQADKLLALGKSLEAAALFETVARVAHSKLNDFEVAIGAHQKVVELKNSAPSLDALAKLYTKKGDLVDAVFWLKKRLAVAEPEERVTTMLRLARTQLKIGHIDEAIGVLEDAFEMAPQNAEVRKLLLEQYRDQKEFEKLAFALERSTSAIHDAKTILSYAKEAATVFFTNLKSPKQAVGVLSRIVELLPESKEEKTMLAEALLDAKQYGEAQSLLEEILKGFGRRRSPARAAIHAKLANVINAQGSIDEAIEHLEQAARMDSHDVLIAKELAEMAKEKGDIELAERTYRTLLMTVRREQLKPGESRIGPSEILLELSFIAEQKGQEDKQLELQESALEALRADDSQAASIEKRLLATEKYEFLVKILEARLSYLKRNVIRARVLSKLGEILENYLDEKDKAFDIRLDAVKGDPSSPENHSGAIRLAVELGRYDEYIGVIENLLKQSRRGADALTRCELLLRLVAARIEQGNRLDEAISLFEQAKELEVREVDVIRIGARLADATGNKEMQVELLTELSKMGETEDGSETHVDALFRLAEIHLAIEETFDEGLEQLNTAFAESGNTERAGRILRRMAKVTDANESLIQVFERVARKSEDKYLSLEYFEMLGGSPSTTPAQIQEGAKLALELEEDARAEALMERIVANSEEHPEYTEAITWAMLGLGHKRLAQKDLAAAVKWFMDATNITDSDDVFNFGTHIAGSILEEGEDIVLASKVYEKLLEIQPGAQDAWGPLTDIYLKLGNLEGFECLVEETMYSMESPSERNLLRLKWAKLLLSAAGRETDAIDVLKNILLDEPGHSDALSLLSQFYKDSGREEELLELLQDRFEAAIERNAVEEVKGLAMELGKQVTDRDELQALYRRGLEISIDDRDLLLSLIDTLDPQEDARERVALLERTLASEAGDNAAALTLKVAAVYREMEDDDGVRRTLKVGFERSPESQELKDALEQDYRTREDFDGLVEMLKQSAGEMTESRARIMAYGEIADIYKEEINDVVGELEALMQMQDFLEGNSDFTIRLIDAFRRAGKYDDALAKAEQMLAEEQVDEKKYELLVLRARMLKSRGDLDGALVDLEIAVSINEEASDIFESALIEKRNQAATDQDAVAEKDSVVMLSNLYTHQNRTEELQELLRSWLVNHGDDVDAWRQLLQLEVASQNQQGVVEACKKLTVLTSGEEQLEIGTTLTDACTVLGELEIARRGLEYIYKENIDGIQVRGHLRKVYEAIGAHHELATFLAHDAKATEDLEARADLFRKAGDAYLKAGDPDTALLALNESLSLEPDNVNSALLVIDIEIEQGDLDGAEDHVDIALEASGRRRSPQHAALQLRKANIAARHGDRMEQLNWLEQAATSARTDGEIAAQLAELAEELEQWDVALKALRNISLMKSECPISKAEAFFRQGRISHQLGDEKRAVLYVKKAIQEDKEHGGAEALLAEIS